MKPRLLRFLPVLGVLALAGCSNRNTGFTAPLPLPPAPFKVLATVPPNNGNVYLNDPIQWVFSAPLDLDTVSANTVRFAVFDALTGEPRDEPVAGSFRFARSAGGEDPAVLEFRPAMPTDAPYTDGGLRPRRRYTVSVSGGDSGPVLRDMTGRRLERTAELQVFTPVGASAAELFRNPRRGGPRVLAWDVVPSLAPAQGTQPAVVSLSLLAHAPIEVRIRFDQALDPGRANLPQLQPLDPRRRAERRRGPIYLVYDDLVFGRECWIPSLSLLERNDDSGAEVVLIPDGVLPNNAAVRVLVEPQLADIAGETNLATAGYQRLLGSFQTTTAYEHQFDAARVDFDGADVIDPDAVFLDPPARLGDGGLHAALEFEGRDTQTDFTAGTGETILNTDTAPGGVFTYRNVTVPANATVRAVGTQPLVLLITGDLRVDGTLSAVGGNGARVDTPGSAHIPTPGGVGVCTGGHGGRGSPETTRSDLVGETGYGAYQVPGLGGQGGAIACGTTGVKRGSGGGGGSHATQGDPLYNDGIAFPNANWVQYRGTGGWGYTNSSTTVNLPGGSSGPARGRDGNPDNDFFGRTVDLSRLERVTGEFVALAGGAGGGGGGDYSAGAACQSGSVNFINDTRGGGGGAGGGVLLVKALGSITVGPAGRITANGGHGNGGHQFGANNMGGGGGGGAGGMVVLMSGTAIVLHRHGGTYLGFTRDYSFSVSADGGASLRGDFGGSPIFDKYPVGDRATGTDTNSGGFGGMGVVQLMAPPGDNSLDGTNTVLDDNVHLIDTDGITRLTGTNKQRYIAWVGMRGRDDAGNPIPDYGGGGDIRPRPHLLPPTFSRWSRARTRWLATGATVRRELSQPDGQPRGLVVTPPDLLTGPDYTFVGTAAASTQRAGWLTYDPTTGQLQPPVLLSQLGVTALAALAGEHLGRSVHKVTLQGTPLGTLADRYAHLRLFLRDGFGVRIGDFRILTHTDHELLLDPADGDLPQSAAAAEVTARLVDVWTDQNRGLGPTYASGPGRLPIANVRIGFAFHQDPANPDLRVAGSDLKRYPPLLGQFVYDLTDPVVRAAVRDFHAECFQVDIRFSLDFTDQDPDRNGGGNPLRTLAPRPEIRSLTIPYRF